MVIQKKILSSEKKIILCFIKYYLPGYRSGGPVRSIVNFVEKFGHEYDIRIICSSHDSINNNPYKGIILEKWNKLGKANVFYVSNKITKFRKIFNLLCNTKYDMIYINSFFTFTFSIFPLLIQYFNFVNFKSFVIAPRGEFSKNALKIKKLKKITYILFAKMLGLYDNHCWQASSQLEAEDIRGVFGKAAINIQIAPDLNSLIRPIPKKRTYKKGSVLKLVFLSRISPMKNLDFLIRFLSEVSYPVQLNILGPKEDIQYWKECNKLINKMPKHIKVIISGEVFPEKVQEAFSKFDLFVFPTRGENFGHVIPEALSSGTPVLLSDKTPWQEDKSTSPGLQIIPLCELKWTKAIEQWANFSDEEILKRRQAAKNYFKKIKLKNKKSILLNKQLFDYKTTCLN
jgi:glycosyltransferase involved in cell wall biosynthesis